MPQRKIEIGKIYGRLKVIECTGVKEIHGKKLRFYLCECSCEENNCIEVAGTYIGRSIKSCGCLQRESREKIIEPGMEFGRLTVLKLYDTIKGRGHRYLCKCGCEKGKEIIVRGDSLRSSGTKSCGCIHDELLREKSKLAYKKIFVYDTSLVRITERKPQRNNTSGVTGVNFHKRLKKWYARIAFQGIEYSLGYFSEFNDAVRVRKEAEKMLFGEFLKWYEERKKENN